MTAGFRDVVGDRARVRRVRLPLRLVALARVPHRDGASLRFHLYLFEIPANAEVNRYRGLNLSQL